MGSPGSPEKPGAPTLTGITPGTSVGVSWTAPADNGNPILHNAMMYTVQGGDSVNESARGSSEILTRISLGTTYEIRVAACNSVGFGPRSDARSATTPSTSGSASGGNIGNVNTGSGIAARGTDGTPDTPAQPTVAGRTDAQAFVEWVVPDDNGSPIMDYVIRYAVSGGTAAKSHSQLL